MSYAATAPSVGSTISLFLTHSPYSVGSVNYSFVPAIAPNAAWPLANLALFIPFVVPGPLVAYKLGWVNGSTTTDNADIGIFDAAMQLLVSSGSTARSGTAAPQFADIADTTLLPGQLYWLGLALAGTSNVRAHNHAACLCSALGMKELTSAFPLPSDASAAVTTTRALLPAVSVECQSR